MAAEPDWLRLQKKIFTRWVNQRLGARRLPPISDVLTDLGKGRTLVNLVEILSDKTCDAKMVDKPRFKAQEIDNMSKALKFIWECGVTMTLKPSAENLLEGDEKNVLGLLWALMMRYLKFQSDDEAEEGQLSAKDALLRWVQLNTTGYKHVEITSYKASFKDGMALCALLHKFKPELIPYDTLLPSDGDDNLLLAMDAAEKAIELEQYVTPADFKKLDEKSLFVYLSEYYTGIQEQRKLALAAKRISKLVQFTVDNDRSKAQYQDSATQIHTRSAAAVKLMTDLREKDNTMKGAQSNLAQFNTFRATEKRALLSELIKLEALYTNLATRLVDNNRPPYVPEDESKSLESLIAGLDSLTATEQTVALELHAEVSRQLKLQRQDRMHKSRFKTLCQWVQEHTDSLPDVSKVTSSGDARHALKFLDACHKESAALKAGSVATLCKLGVELESEKFEFIAEVKKRETEVGERFEDLDKLMTSKQAPFEDALAREQFKENLRLSVQVHSDLCKQLQAWGDERKAYLRTKETIASSDEALLQISLLEAFREEKNDMAAGSVTSLKQLGAEIRAAEYKSEFSQWKYERPQEVTALEQAVDALWSEFDTLSQDKQALLDDHLARELYAEETRLIAGQHVDKSKQILAWAAEKNAYLQVREPCDTVGDAQFLISTLDTFVKEKAAMTATNVASLQQLGKTVLSRKYATSFSSYAFEHPQDIKSREAEVLQEWATLDALAADKAPFLQDHLARNTFQNKIRLWVSSHKDMSAKLEAWLADRERYLNTRKDIASVQSAQLQRSLLDAYRQEAEDTKQGALASLKKLGSETREAVYKTEHSEWTLPAEGKAAVSALEQAADDTFEKHAGLAETKQAYLDDALARERFKQKVRMWVGNHQEMYHALAAWTEEKVAYLQKKEDVTSSEEATQQLSLLDLFETDKAGKTDSSVPALKELGGQVRAAKYESELSKWSYEHPEALTELESKVTGFWAQLSELSAKKRDVLTDDLERELYAEETRLLADQHERKYNQLSAWAADKKAYLETREEVPSVPDSHFHLAVRDTFEAEKTAKSSVDVASLQQLGKTVLARQYKTALSEYKYETPELVTTHEAEIHDAWSELSKLSAVKLEVLQDHLARNTFKDKVEVWVMGHKDMSGKLEAWLADRERYLNTREDTDAVQAAQLQRSLLDAYRREASDAKQGALASLKKLGGEAREAAYKTKHSEWTLPADVKDAVSALEQAADDTFERHAGLAETKQAYLDDALAREQLRSKVLLLADRHAGVFGRMQDWVGQKDTYLKTTEDVHSIADAQVCLRLLEAFDTEREQLWSTTVDSLKQLGAEVLATKYNTELSSWEFPTPAAITDSEATLDAAKTSLTSASATKKKVLDADLAREIVRENLRLDFASESTAYERFVKDTCIFVGARSDDPTAGFTLQQFEQLGNEQATECTSIRADSKSLTAAYEKPFNDLASYGSTDNPYTTLTVESLKMLEQDLEVALDTRDQDYQTGLARLHADDALCKKLSEEAATVLKDINSSLGHLTRPQGTLQEQLALVVRLREESKALATRLTSVQRLDEELAQRNVTFNPHSTVTYKDLEVQLRDYCEILEQKQPLIEQEIEFKKLRGVSSEQLAEMEQFFKQFDKDGSNSIEKKELKACLYSLGEELSNAEIGELFATYGTGDKLVLEQFRELMVQLLGVSHTKENISEAFFYLSRSKEHAPLDVLDKHFKPDEVAFLKQTTPPTPEGIPFPEFVEIAFSR